MIKKISMCALVLVAGAHFSFAQNTISIPVLKDNTIYEDVNGELSNGAGNGFIAGNNGGGESKRALLAFDLSSIPANATIKKVTLKLYLTKGKTTADDVKLHKLNKDWGEGTSNADGGAGQGDQATTDDATWVHTFYNSQMWTTPGGDFEATESASLSLTDVEGSYEWTSAQMLADLESWIANPSTNFGWILIGNESTTGTTRHFSSKEASTESQRPILVVEYEDDKSGVNVISQDLFNIYPNPFSSSVQISATDYDGIMTVKILNSQMQEVYLNHTVSAGENLNLNMLSTGIYYAVITTEKGVSIKKIMKTL